MNFKSMLCRSVVTVFLIFACAFLCAVLVTNAESEEVKVIQEISEPNLIIQIEEKIPIEELEKEFPEEKEVILDSGETVILAVSWKCECDYTNEDYDSYVFEAQFPEGYVLSENCSSSFIKVTINEADVPVTYADWPANPDSTKRYDAYLGVSGNIVEWLEKHEDDDYYLGTPYYGDLDYPRKCTRANGEYKSMGYDSAGMNCTGFVASVMRKLGGDLDKIIDYSNWGTYSNAYNWHYTVHAKSIKSYRYTSVADMLAGGHLEKGDIIYFEPDWTISGVDCHMGFFWGDTSDDNKFWHSYKGEGNVITKIKSKSSYKYVYIFKVTPPGKLKLTKTSANQNITEGNARYTLKDAVFGVYTTYNQSTGSVSGRVGTLTTVSGGTSNTISLDAGTYYIKELTAPTGYIRSSQVKKVTLTSGKTTSVTIKNEPQASVINILLEKMDAETKETVPAEGREFKDAKFVVKFYKKYYDDVSELEGVTPTRTWTLKTDENGICKMTDEYKVSGKDFYTNSDGKTVFPLGTVTIQETKAPVGYEINDEVFLIKITANSLGKNVSSFQTVSVPEKQYVPETPVIPATGDESNLMVLILSVLLSCVIIVKCVRITHRK